MERSENSNVDFVEIIRKYSNTDPDETVFLVPNTQDLDTQQVDHDGNRIHVANHSWKNCSWGVLDQLLTTITHRWSQSFKDVIESHPEHHPTVGILITPPQDFLPPALALTSLGFQVMPINPFLPPAQVAKLLDVANCKFLLSGSGEMKAIGELVLSNMPKDSRLHSLAPDECLGNIVNNNLFPNLPTPQEKLPTITKPILEPAYLLHSTGSTGLPKLVPWRHSALVSQIKPIVQGFMAADGAAKVDRTMFITRDLFAVIPIGIVLKTIYLGPGWKVAFPTFHTLHHTVVDILEDLLALENCSDFSIYTADVSSILNFLDPDCPNSKLDSPEETARKQLYLEKLRKFPAVPTGGSKLLDATMAQAIRMGLRVQVTYGTTESGACLASDPSLIPDQDWGVDHDSKKMSQLVHRSLALRPIPFFKVFFMQVNPESNPSTPCGSGTTNGNITTPLTVNNNNSNHPLPGTGYLSGPPTPNLLASPLPPMEPLYELQIDANQAVFSSPSSANDDSHSRWRTRDLFRKYTYNNEDLWIYETRMDDMLMLGNGGAVYPLKIEDKIYNGLKSTSLEGRVQLMLSGTSRPFPSLLVEFQPFRTPISTPQMGTKLSLPPTPEEPTHNSNNNSPPSYLNVNKSNGNSDNNNNNNNDNSKLSAPPKGNYFPPSIDVSKANSLTKKDSQASIQVFGATSPGLETLSDEDFIEAKRVFIDAFESISADVNLSFPQYSKLNTDMIYFLAPHERLCRTIKENINRKKSEMVYSPQLDQLYEAKAKSNLNSSLNQNLNNSNNQNNSVPALAV